MNFFERQAAARRSSSRLVLLFGVAVVAIVLAVDAVAWLLSGSPGVLLAVTLATLATIGLGSLYRLASLGDGGDAIATQLGGELLVDDGGDLDLRRLRNVVEEIAIASGVPVPKIYVLEHESAINAFAAGYSTSDAVVAVTRGALDRLNRDELQGVIAHEFSHILNGDMRLNLRLVGVLFGIAMIAIAGRKVMEFSVVGRRGRSVGVVVFAAVVALVVGSIGLFCARLIKAGVSRNRERLADASAVQFTRQTAGLAGALKKIGGLPDGSRLASAGDAEEVSHMLFGEGLGFDGLFGGWLATHPPLVERIQALEPGFRAEQLDALSRRWLQAPPSGLHEDLHLGLHAPGALPSASAEHAVTGAMVSTQVGNPGRDDYRRADAIVGGLSYDLRALVADRERVVPLLLGLLLDAREDIAARQAFEIGARLGKATAIEAAHLREQHLADLHPMLRLPLVALAFPVVRRRPRPQLEVFLDAVNALVLADDDVSLFEYCLSRLLTVQLRESLDPSRHVAFGRRKATDLAAEIATLLAVVAQAGHADAAAAQHAYLAGMQRILPREHVVYRPPANVPLALEDVWTPLDSLDPLAKQLLVEAVTVAASHDGRVSVAEAELLRTVCGVLHCPLPPVLDHA
ncbi:M48 family metallopeptidase [Novilysobacter erysipheiresistens]|uniref:M48 family metallopeptidase n=1 Tax=Novilysobacter erysipheiresistens TaxID=1749332 RepID=A0ABU7Z1V4_9GAMM